MSARTAGAVVLTFAALGLAGCGEDSTTAAWAEPKRTPSASPTTAGPSPSVDRAALQEKSKTATVAPKGFAGIGISASPKEDKAVTYNLTLACGKQTDAETKGMLVVHGKYMAFVRANLDRKTWDQQEPADERAKKIIAAYQGLAATCGEFSIEGNVITLQQLAQASPLTMGKAVKWEYKLEGNTLKIKPVANPGVEFTFERMPE